MNFISGESWGLSWLGPQHTGPGPQALLEGMAIGECDPWSRREEQDEEARWLVPWGCLFIPLGPSTCPCEWVSERLQRRCKGSIDQSALVSTGHHWPYRYLLLPTPGMGSLWVCVAGGCVCVSVGWHQDVCSPKAGQRWVSHTM